MFIKKLIRSVVDKKIPRIYFLYRTIRDQIDRHQPFRKTPWDFWLAGNDIMASGNFESEETLLIRKMLCDVDVFVNVGANIGYYCCHALSLGKQVIAIEPISRNLHYLMRNIIKNGWTNQIEIFPVAASAETNIMKIYGGDTGASLIKGWASNPQSYFTLTPTLTLDRIICNKLVGKKALILIDVEGAEYEVLRGATNILKNNPSPLWIVEITYKMHQPKTMGTNPKFLETFQIFFNESYKCFTADNNLTNIDFETIKLVYKDNEDLKTYNFLFRKD